MIIEHKSIHKVHQHPYISFYRPHIGLQPLLDVLKLPLLVSMIFTTCPLGASLGISLTCGLVEQGQWPVSSM